MMFWIADYVELFEDGSVKYFKDGKEIPYPWELLSDDDEELGSNKPPS